MALEDAYRSAWPTDAAGLKQLLVRDGISRATAYRRRRLAKAKPDRPLENLVRKRGRPPLRDETLYAIRIAVMGIAAAAKSAWQKQRQGKRSHPKTAMPWPQFYQYRAAVRKAGVTCSDSKIRDVLREKGFRTARQRRFTKAKTSNTPN
jgi:hypothetical protein